ncbi:tyrosine-type recombinase/integrase [Thermoactinomyces sp. CICC 10522]|uniref:tyrosine-type recombinase/integrase n=1 Tax=Thermoactinomyces sp. CICC 10522 TaxID=2767427 RepID=UPI0018DB4558|nr:tyrosine-type recombinase/integrase [Thermoactinomyces sp. CICC 10522]
MKKSVVELNGFTRYLEEQGKSAKTIADYKRHVNNFAAWLTEQGGDIDTLTRHDVQQYMKYLENIGNKAATIKVKYIAITTYARYINRSDIIENIRRPEARQNRNIAPKSLARNEYNRLLREAEREGARTAAIVYTLLYTGLRVSELVALNIDDVKLGERSGSVTVRNGKGQVARTVPLPAEARHHIRQYLATRTDDEPALFVSNYKRRMSVRSIQRVIDKLGTHPHAIRHTYARRLVEAGTDIATVAELMGHTDINVTRRYAKPDMNDLENAVAKVFG